MIYMKCKKEIKVFENLNICINRYQKEFVKMRAFYRIGKKTLMKEAFLSGYYFLG
jgi:hypothetical protein